jgi:glutathione S-transferase
VKRTVWGIGTPRTLRPLWALAELGLEYDHRKILPRGPGMEDPPFRALSERHKVPFFEDDRVKIGESAAIVGYLADRHGGDVLPMPAPGTAEGAVLLDRTLFIMTEIDARIYTVRLHGEPPGGLAAVYGAAPMAVQAAKDYVYKSLQEAARWSQERFGTADILLASCLEWARRYEIDLPTLLGDYRDRVASRPGYQAAMASNDPSRATTD